MAKGQLAFYPIPCFDEEMTTLDKAMTTITVEEFFRRYEHANHDFDAPSIVKFYADTFMFGNPQGVQAVKKENFVKLLPRRKDFMKTAGLLSSRVDSVEASALDSKHMLVKTVWNMQFRTNQGAEVVRKTAATYVLSATGDTFEIVCQLDHQDLMKIGQDLNAPVLR